MPRVAACSVDLRSIVSWLICNGLIDSGECLLLLWCGDERYLLAGWFLTVDRLACAILTHDLDLGLGHTVGEVIGLLLCKLLLGWVVDELQEWLRIIIDRQLWGRALILHLVSGYWQRVQEGLLLVVDLGLRLLVALDLLGGAVLLNHVGDALGEWRHRYWG